MFGKVLRQLLFVKEEEQVPLTRDEVLERIREPYFRVSKMYRDVGSSPLTPSEWSTTDQIWRTEINPYVDPLPNEDKANLLIELKGFKP